MTRKALAAIAIALAVVVGVWVIARAHNSDGGAETSARTLSISQATTSERNGRRLPSPVTASTRRLRVGFDVGGICDGREPSVLPVKVQETATTVVLLARYVPISGGGACSGLYAEPTVSLRTPLGRRQVTNAAGTASVYRGG